MTLEIAQDGTGAGGEAPPVACGLEYDLFISPTDSNYVNVPINLIVVRDSAPSVSVLLSCKA